VRSAENALRCAQRAGRVVGRRPPLWVGRPGRDRGPRRLPVGWSHHAPDSPGAGVNPTKQGFGSLRSNELANLCADAIGEVVDIAEDGQGRIGGAALLCFAFLRHTGLRVWSNTAASRSA